MQAGSIDIELSVRNFRCVGNHPASLRIRDGFTAVVGTNNSGKSSLLRIPYEFRSLWARLGALAESFTAGGRQVEIPYEPVLPPGERQLRAGCDDFELVLDIHNSSAGPLRVGGILTGIRFAVKPAERRIKATVTRPSLVQTVVASSQQRQMLHAPLVETAQLLCDSMYVGPFRNALSLADAQPYFDLVIGTGFVKTFAEYKSGNNAVHNEAVVRLTENVRRIFGYRSLDINPSPDQVSLQVTIDGRSFRLSELGAGIAHFIVVLVNVLVRQPTFLLIDEPELNLHAALQLDFLSALAESTTHGVVFATHSLGLARSSAEHITVIAQHGESGSRSAAYEGHENLPSLAAQLGFDGRPEIGFQKILLVEGKSEVRALLQILRHYGKEHQVALIPLGGGELIQHNSDVELRELARLGPVTYFIDSERDAAEGAPSPRHAAFVDLCNKLGIYGHMLQRRALENYFPQRALDAAFGAGKYVALGPFEAPAGATSWAKKHNWRIAAEMTRAEIAATDLGQFIEQL